MSIIPETGSLTRQRAVSQQQSPRIDYSATLITVASGGFHQKMTQTPDALVTEFCRKWASPDAAELASYFTEDGIYHNVPMDPVQGPEAIKEFIAGFTAAFDGIDFQVHRQVSDGNIVMNERTDVMRRKDGGEIALPVMGVFEVVDGKIAKWSDYFDMATVTKAFG